MKYTGSFLFTAFMILGSAAVFAADRQVEDYSKTIDIYHKSPEVEVYFKNSYGYAVFPTIGKAGFIIGGSYGEGQVYRDDKVTGFTTVGAGSIGLQVGAQAFSQIIFFQDQRAYDAFTGGSFEFDAMASAVAITAGAQASVGGTGQTAGASAGPATAKQASTSYRKGMTTFIHAKGGLMAEASIGGQKFSFEALK